jgi:uncharacterized protein
MKTRLLLFLFITVGYGFPVTAQNLSFKWYSPVRDSLVTIPAATGFVNDFDTVFSATEINTLDSIIGGYEQKTGNQIAIVTIDSLFNMGEQLKDFAEAVGKFWGVGQKEKDNGIVIVFGTRQRKIWIATGNGIRYRLSDEWLGNMIRETIIPHFKEHHYFEGIREGLLAMVKQSE